MGLPPDRSDLDPSHARHGGRCSRHATAHPDTPGNSRQSSAAPRTTARSGTTVMIAVTTRTHFKSRYGYPRADSGNRALKPTACPNSTAFRTSCRIERKYFLVAWVVLTRWRQNADVFRLTSPAFEHGQEMAQECGKRAQNVSPP